MGRAAVYVDYIWAEHIGVHDHVGNSGFAVVAGDIDDREGEDAGK